jgi:imidazolonepropionase-like amidohydrolase
MPDHRQTDREMQDYCAAVPATLYRDCAVLDLEAGALVPETSILVEDGRVAWIGSCGDEPEPPPDAEVVDAGGTTALPGMVDAHSHLTMPGGSHWIDRGFDPTERLVAAAEDNARLLRQAGVRWARDVGAPVRDGRAVSLTVRDAWRGRPEYPYVRAAGAWVARRGRLPTGLSVEVDDGDGLLAAAVEQLDAGADLVKLYLDGPDADVSPFTASEVRRVVEAAHARGAPVTAHSSLLPGARAGVAGGVDSLEHGFQLDADVAAAMAAGGTALVSTLAVLESWRTFGSTTRIPRFAEDEGRDAIAARREQAHESVRLAHAAGVMIATGTDFGGGSLRANQLAWEVQTLVEAGLAPAAALAACTVNGGRLLGEPDAGVLRPGGPADFVLVHGDPLSEPAALWRVWRTTW